MKKCVVLLCPGLFERIRLFSAVWALWENKNHDMRKRWMGFARLCKMLCKTYWTMNMLFVKLFLPAGKHCCLLEPLLLSCSFEQASTLPIWVWISLTRTLRVEALHLKSYKMVFNAKVTSSLRQAWFTPWASIVPDKRDWVTVCYSNYEAILDYIWHGELFM